MRTGSHRKRVYFINNIYAGRVSWRKKKISRAYRRNFERTANDNGTDIHICLLVLRKYHLLVVITRACVNIYIKADVKSLNNISFNLYWNWR